MNNNRFGVTFQNATEAMTKSLRRMNIAADTYARMAALPTPSAPPSALKP
jgi:hypothetical protein